MRREGADVRLDWPGYSGDAASFNAYRSMDSTALPPRAVPAPSAARVRGTTWLDASSAGSLLFYVVQAVNGCGAE